MPDLDPRDLVDAFQWAGNTPDQNCPSWFLTATSGNAITMESFPDGTAKLSIARRGSWSNPYLAARGDWIVRDTQGGMRPYSPEDFEKWFAPAPGGAADTVDDIDMLPVIRAVIGEANLGMFSRITLPELRARVVKRQGVNSYMERSHVAA